MNAFLKALSSLLLVLYYWLESIVLWFVPKRLRYKDVTGETVLITGAGSGIGRLLATRFSNLRCRVVVWDVNEKGAAETVQMIKESGGEAFSYRCDISQPEEVYATAAKVKEEVGKITILVNNAGIVTGKRFLDCPDAMIKKTFEVNVMAHFWMCKAFLPDMIEANHGHIVSVASLAGLCGVVRLSDYCASKFAAVGFEESLRMELHVEGHRGIFSTVICPYFINTGMFAGAKPGIFTMMTPEFVADEIVSAMLVNQEILVLPKVFYFLLALKALLPTHAIREALDVLSIFNVMSRFSGRSEDIGKSNGHVPKSLSNGHHAPDSMQNGRTHVQNGHVQNSTENGHAIQNGHATNALQNGHATNALQNGHAPNAQQNGHCTTVANGKVKVG